ncbi:MAG TPA: membrane protein insertion efficiency factor YidD [Gammaproteobacteria bacterium]|jgi:putative membrane protein insertion efficiency factor
MRDIAVKAIKGYQYAISPFMGNHCRFSPSCSNYALEAIQIHGLAKGSLLGIKRIGRCHPWHPGGYDPVPGPDQDPINS